MGIHTRERLRLYLVDWISVPASREAWMNGNFPKRNFNGVCCSSQQVKEPRNGRSNNSWEFEILLRPFCYQNFFCCQLVVLGISDLHMVRRLGQYVPVWQQISWTLWQAGLGQNSHNEIRTAAIEMALQCFLWRCNLSAASADSRFIVCKRKVKGNAISRDFLKELNNVRLIFQWLLPFTFCLRCREVSLRRSEVVILLLQYYPSEWTLLVCKQSEVAIGNSRWE